MPQNKPFEEKPEKNYACWEPNFLHSVYIGIFDNGKVQEIGRMNICLRRFFDNALPECTTCLYEIVEEGKGVYRSKTFPNEIILFYGITFSEDFVKKLFSHSLESQKPPILVFREGQSEKWKYLSLKKEPAKKPLREENIGEEVPF